MLFVLLNVLAPVIGCVLVGYVWGKTSADFPNQFISRMVTYVAAPCLIVSTMSEYRFDTGLLYDMALLSLITLAGVALLGWSMFRFVDMPFRPFSLAMVFPNTGNIGLSLCLFAFGEEGLALALIPFVVISLIHFASGDIVLNKSESRREGIIIALRQPILLATLLVLAQIILDFQLPKPILSTTKLLGGMTIPLMLVTLGVSLSAIHPGSWSRGAIVAGIRVFGGLLVCSCAIWLVGTKGLPAKVMLVQASMPSAVFNYFFAMKYDTEVDSVASAVMISTVVSLALMIPLLGYLNAS
jgi:hypothetical protein